MRKPVDKMSKRLRLKEPRLAPLREEQWTEHQRKLLDSVKTPSGNVFNIYSTLVRHPLLLERWLPFLMYVLGEQSLPPRDREILILRAGWLCQSEYIFGQHTMLARGAGLTDDEIFRITKGPDAPGWSRSEAALIRAADETREDAFITDATWGVLAETYNEKQLTDIVFTCGQYSLASTALNCLGVQREPGVPGFPGEGTAAVPVKKKYSHVGPPAFSIEYPHSYEKDDPLFPDEIFRAKDPFEIPSFGISVSDPSREEGKLEDRGRKYASLLEGIGTDVRILSRRQAKLRDGTPSQEFTMEWKYIGALPILSLIVTVQKDDKIISWMGSVLGGDLTPVREIVQTWELV